MHNVEFKAELRELAIAKATCRKVGATHILGFDQTDTYFRVPSGRLKRRETSGEPVEFIFYERPNRAGPKISQFMIYSEAQALERFGREPLPVWVTVRKHRDLWMVGNVRIHLDQVEGLGTFLEFEALVSRECGISACRSTLDALIAEFRPILGEPIDGSYSDMIARLADHAAEARPGGGLA